MGPPSASGAGSTGSAASRPEPHPYPPLRSSPVGVSTSTSDPRVAELARALAAHHPGDEREAAALAADLLVNLFEVDGGLLAEHE